MLKPDANESSEVEVINFQIKPLSWWQKLFGVYCEDVDRRVRKPEVYLIIYYYREGFFGNEIDGMLWANKPVSGNDVYYLPYDCTQTCFNLRPYCDALALSNFNQPNKDKYTIGGLMEKIGKLPAEHRPYIVDYLSMMYPSIQLPESA